MRHTALTIAGSDSSGGAGIQADLKSFLANGVYGMSAITALTAQNTLGVTQIWEVSPEFLTAQIDAVFEDIPPESVKIGMVSSPELIDVIACGLRQYSAKNIVLDPVMVATSGAKLISQDAVQSLCQKLIPMATLITPNIPEAKILSGRRDICSKEEMEQAAREIYERFQVTVLLKGGHSLNDANDYLYGQDGGRWFLGQRIDNPNTHGTGCTLSSAIAAHLAKGESLEQSIAKAKEYLSEALRAMLDLGQGSGPVDHGYFIQ